METELARIAERARKDPKFRFQTLVHYINERTLTAAHENMDGRKAVGVDGVSKASYGENLEANIADLVARMKRQAYKPKVVRRVFIPKPGSTKKRPLGIPAYEDKLVQAVMVKILNAIYEQEFLGFSYGFRPGRSAHDALKHLNNIIEEQRVNYIVDADIKGFFDHVDHDWMMKFLKERIEDPNMLRLIVRFLKAGVMEAGIEYDTPEGTPQGGVISPLLANVYLHYVLDLWFQKVARKQCRGKSYMVRYADDFVCCFQYEEDARAFYESLQERLAKFNLELAEDKSRIIAFGKHAEDEAKRNGGQKPDTFDFLGFTHYCGKSRKGSFRVKRQTSRKKFQSSVARLKEWLRINRHRPVPEIMATMRRKLQGHYNYYGITDNSRALERFEQCAEELLFKWLNRRSQRRSFKWDKFEKLLRKYPLPRPRICVRIYDLNWELLS